MDWWCSVSHHVICQYWKWKLIGHVQLFVIPWTVALQAPLSMGILEAWIPEWIAMPSSRGSFQPGDWTQVSRIAGGLDQLSHQEHNFKPTREYQFVQDLRTVNEAMESIYSIVPHPYTIMTHMPKSRWYKYLLIVVDIHWMGRGFSHTENRPQR